MPAQANLFFDEKTDSWRFVAVCEDLEDLEGLLCGALETIDEYLSREAPDRGAEQ